MITVIGANGFLGKAIATIIKKEIREEILCLTRQDFDLLSANAPYFHRHLGTVVYCADYYRGLEHASAHQEEIHKVNVDLFAGVIRLLENNNYRWLVSIGTTACYPILNRPLNESLLMNLCASDLNPKLLGYAMSRFDIISRCRKMRISHTHIVLPTLFGEGDKFEQGRSHLVASWIRDFYEMKLAGQRRIQLWGSPDVRRELMYIYDAAKYIYALIKADIREEIINVGCGLSPSHEILANTILDTMDFGAHSVTWDLTRINARMAEILDLSLLKRYEKRLPETTPFHTAMRETINFYAAQKEKANRVSAGALSAATSRAFASDSASPSRK